MTHRSKVAFFGSSLVSSYWNGAATYYRGLIRALSVLGYRTTFYEPDAFERQQHRDIANPTWADTVVYPATEQGVSKALEAARQADILVKASGVGVFDEWLEREVLSLQAPNRTVIFWDVDAPATLERVQQNPDDPFRTLIPRYDIILTYGGGPPVVEAYRALGARDCVPVYNALDPATHYPVPPDPRLAANLAFLGNRLPDREARVHEFFFEPAKHLPEARFLLGGSGWECNAPALSNLRYRGHVYAREHNAFNCSSRMILNINRSSMARFGYSPATRVFEAAGAGACIVTDAWEGIEQFLEPDREILVARTGDDVIRYLRTISEARARAIGAAGMRRVVAEHTYAHRAAQVHRILNGLAGDGALSNTHSPQSNSEGKSLLKRGNASLQPQTGV
ncbi:CgeB family protein [Methylocaldum sp.]|uniref:CgeB family protein n=1 Tax=Methylocaldum sp. TaxID=1969727 RepID=UPI002D67E04F|nr:glycosyltransferase [Methylocaldum sp.]HYE33879.1 glycosyltransferase [Methylocaldum sp.]